jgi:hypothetical protein
MNTILFSLIFIAISSTAVAESHVPFEKEWLKSRITKISQANQMQSDNRLRVRNKLDPLINRLLEITPSQSEAERSSLVVGSWRSLWSDQVFGQGVDNSQVYQVVSNDGFYYNISRVDSERGVFTNFLRGAYEVKGSYLAIEFTSNKLVPSFYPPSTNLTNLANRFEEGEIEAFPIPGPIGVTGALLNIYVDHDLRIVYGNSMSDSRPRVFILSRQEIIGD